MFLRGFYWLVEFGALFALWLLFVFQLRSTESLVGLFAAALGATAVEAVRGCEHPHFLPDFRWLLEFRRVPWRILRDSWMLVRTLAGDRSGSFRSRPFTSGGNDSRSVARRVLATLYETLPPGSIVIGIDRRRNEMLLHVLGDER
jgi:multisubunit Na+/H+ antiporter MnhE subunit